MNNEYTSPANTISSGEDYEEYMVGKNKCPECESKLEQMTEPNGPEDYYVTGVYCENCNYQTRF